MGGMTSNSATVARPATGKFSQSDPGAVPPENLLQRYMSPQEMALRAAQNGQYQGVDDSARLSQNTARLAQSMALMPAPMFGAGDSGAANLSNTFGNIGSLFGAPGSYSSPSGPTYAQPMAAQASAVPLSPAGAPTTTSGGANYNAISALLGRPVGAGAGYAPPAYKPPPVYMSEEQRRAMQPQPQPTPTPGIVPSSMTEGDGGTDEGAPRAPSGPAPFDPNAYDYSGNLRGGFGLSGADIGRFLTNAAATTIPVVGMANTASSLFGGPNIGSAIFGERQPAQPLTSIAYDPVFQAAQREAGGYYRDPWGGIYKDGEALTEIPQDFIAQEQAKQSERGAIDTDWGYNPNAAPEEPPQSIGDVDSGYVPDDGGGGNLGGGDDTGMDPAGYRTD
jgi:hypothetical protein